MKLEGGMRAVDRSVVAGLLFIVADLLLAPGAARAQSAPMKVGEFLDITGGGASAAEAARLGVELAVHEINQGGGIGGRKIELLTSDTQTDPTVGVGEIKRLVLQEKVELVFGPLISQVALAALPVMNQAKTAAVGTTGSDQITVEKGPYYFSILINAESQAKAMIAQAEKVLHAKSGAIISDSGAQAKSFVESMKREMEARGIKLTGTQEYQYRATDMTPQLLNLKRGTPDTLFLFSSSGEDVGNVLKSLDDIGWTVKVTGNYTVATFADAAIRIAGKEPFQKFDVSGIAYKAFTYCKADDLPKPYLEFAAKAKAFRAAEAARLSLPYAATLYDAVVLFKEAVEGSGGKTDGPTIAAWIEQNAQNHRGVLGPLNASPTSHWLVGPDQLTAVYPDRLLEAGIQQRYGC
jgi:ABC-type branched-subunit amino acid transport system substrate-binding protein